MFAYALLVHQKTTRFKSRCVHFCPAGRLPARGALSCWPTIPQLICLPMCSGACSGAAKNVKWRVVRRVREVHLKRPPQEWRPSFDQVEVTRTQSLQYMSPYCAHGLSRQSGSQNGHFGCPPGTCTWNRTRNLLTCSQTGLHTLWHHTLSQQWAALRPPAFRL